MFRIHRSRWTAVLVVVALLVALPAVAGETRGGRVAEPGWWAQVISWLSQVWSGHRAPSTKSSSYIDPLGRTNTTASPDYSSGIDPLGQQ